MLVLCDFDGTISVEDVTNLVLDKFTGTGWRTKILPRYHAGQINHFDIMSLSYADLSIPPDELRAFYKAVPIRPHFNDLVDLCKVRGWPLVIVSGGLHFYIKDFLPPELPIHSYLGEFDEEAKVWRVSRPDWPVVESGEDFKVRVFEELRLQYPDAGPSVFIGDGQNDFKVASHTDFIFAVKGKQLARMCQEAHQPHTEFDDFAVVVDGLIQEGEKEKSDGK